MFKRTKRESPEDPDNDPEYIPEPEPSSKPTPSPKPTSSPKSTPSALTEDKMEEIKAQLDQVMAKLQVSENRQKESEDKITGLTENLNKFQSIEIPKIYKDVTTDIAIGGEIVLESYKAIPEFSGDQKKISFLERTGRTPNGVD